MIKKDTRNKPVKPMTNLRPMVELKAFAKDIIKKLFGLQRYPMYWRCAVIYVKRDWSGMMNFL
jgi:hypothetical protein